MITGSDNSPVRQVIREDTDGIVPLNDTYTTDGRLERGIAYRVREKLRSIFGETVMARMEGELTEALGSSLDEWLAAEFIGYHVTLYRLRPIVYQITSRSRSRPAFSCFVYWHKLDTDTLRKVQEVYIRPVLEGTQREVERLATQYTEQRQSGASLRSLRDTPNERCRTPRPASRNSPT